MECPPFLSTPPSPRSFLSPKNVPTGRYSESGGSLFILQAVSPSRVRGIGFPSGTCPPPALHPPFFSLSRRQRVLTCPLLFSGWERKGAGSPRLVRWRWVSVAEKKLLASNCDRFFSSQSVVLPASSVLFSGRKAARPAPFPP